MRRPITWLLLTLVAAAIVGAAACGSNSGDKSNDPTPGVNSKASAIQAEKVTLHLGYFPNITHAPGLVGVARGTFAQELGPNVTLDVKSFNAGPDVITALFAGDIDISYIGSGPSINGYVKSNGDALRIISGATSGGALFIVRPEAGITTPADLAGKKIASPQLGNTQDVALRSYLQANGLSAPQEGGGDVNVVPTANSDTLNLFKQGSIDGAWVPEPWATRLVQEAGGTVFLDERDLWPPNGDFVTTTVIVRTEFLNDHPDVVEHFLKAHVETIQWINDNPAEAKTITNDAINQITQASLVPAVIDAAWEHLRFTYEPLASALRKSANDAFKLGFLDEEPDLSGIYDLDPLNTVLQGMNLPAVSD